MVPMTKILGWFGGRAIGSGLCDLLGIRSGRTGRQGGEAANDILWQRWAW